MASQPMIKASHRRAWATSLLLFLHGTASVWVPVIHFMRWRGVTRSTATLPCRSSKVRRRTNDSKQLDPSFYFFPPLDLFMWVPARARGPGRLNAHAHTQANTQTNTQTHTNKHTSTLTHKQASNTTNSHTQMNKHINKQPHTQHTHTQASKHTNTYKHTSK